MLLSMTAHIRSVPSRHVFWSKLPFLNKSSGRSYDVCDHCFLRCAKSPPAYLEQLKREPFYVSLMNYSL